MATRKNINGKLKIKSPYAKKMRTLKSAEKMREKKTWPEREFEDIMKELGIPFEDQKILGKKIYDFYLPTRNMIIEIHGDYWHGNPNKFESFNKTQVRNKKNDIFKKNQAINNGYLYNEVWEDDLKNKRQEVVELFKSMFS